MEYNNETTALRQISEILSRTTKTLDSIFDYTWIRILVENPLFFNILSGFKIKQKGVAVRFITTINHENLSYCTKLMKFVELRHIDEIIGYLGITDKEHFFYVQPLFGQENKVNQENINNNLQLNFIFLSNQDFIQMQSNLFEKLWELSIPANNKIAEIKRKMFEKSLLNTNFNDLDIIKRVITKVIQSANKEVLLFFPTIYSFWLIEESNRLIELLVDVLDRYVKVNIIIHMDEDSNIKEKTDQKIKQYSQVLGTYVNYSTKKIDTKTILLISDQAISLTISLKNHDQNTKIDTIETASLSNDELNISTFLSFFDSLWIRSEIEKQNILKQTYYKIFKEPQLRDENYRRKWIFENTNKDR